MAVLEVEHLSISSKEREIVKDVSFTIEKGECLAIIGESGSGKSITASCIGRILPKALSITNGTIRVHDREVTSLNKEELRKARGEVFSYVFQDYQSAFTPFIKVGKQMHEMICAHKKMSKEERTEKILKSLENVGLDAKRIYNSYPFQMSGGQMQRCAIAQAMILEPELLIADEPTTALDSVSTITVLELIERIKRESDCSVLFISHDLRTVKKYADKIAIMYKGEIVEYRNKDEIIHHPQHIYTKNLFAAIPPLLNVPDRLPVLEMKE